MPTRYNLIAGQSVERLAALSDGIFAVAMTLLVLDLHVPVREVTRNEHDLSLALLALTPRLVAYTMSFLTLGIFWVGQQSQLNYLTRSNRSLSWIHIAFLFAVSLMPFSTSLLAEYYPYRFALLAYWFNILLLGVVLYFSWLCATQSGLLKPDTGPHVSQGIKGRIIIGQALYAFGALLCIFDTRWSIAFIIFVQLYYAIGPRFLRRSTPQ